MAKLSNDKTYVTVEKGDTLSAIALKYLGSASKYKTLASINGLSNSDRLSIGQKIYLKKKTGSGSSGGSSGKNKKYTSMAKITNFGLQSDLENTLFATWKFDREHVDNYKVQWQIYTKDKYWFTMDDSTTTYKFSTYQIPSNATRVRFRVKPVAKKHKVKKTTQTKKNGKTVSTTKEVEEAWWTVNWTDRSKYVFNVSLVPPETPSSAPSVEINKTKLTATLANLDSSITACEFQIVRGDKKVVKTGTAKTSKLAVSYSCTITLGSEYKVRYRAIKDKLKSGWSPYSDNIGTIPSTPKKITRITAKSETEIQLEWSKTSNAKGYEIQYTTLRRYFDSSDNVSSTSVTGKTHAEITGLESGTKYWFRVRATNDQGESGWTEEKEGIVGKKPEAPTTWSSTTTAVEGENVNFYWVHNSVDGSSQTYAQIQMEMYDNIDQLEYTKIYDTTIKNTSSEDEKDKTKHVDLPTLLTLFDNLVIKVNRGVRLKWRVRTKGILNEWSDWSTKRVVDIYLKPSIELNLYSELPTYTLVDPSVEPEDWSTNYNSYFIKDLDGNYIQLSELDLDSAPVWADDDTSYYSSNRGEVSVDTLTTLPLIIWAVTAPYTQAVIGFNVSVVANETYETVDNVGNLKIVKNGDEVYSENLDSFYFKVSTKGSGSSKKYYRSTKVYKSSELRGLKLVEGVETTNGDRVYTAIIAEEGKKIYVCVCNELLLSLGAGDLNLENGMSYTVKCVASMDSGLIAEESADFSVSWVEREYSPDATIGIDDDIFSATIKPECRETAYVNYEVTDLTGLYVATTDVIEAAVYGEVLVDAIGEPITTTTGEVIYQGMTEDDEEVLYYTVGESTLVNDVSLSVYRREFDGGYTEIASNLPNTGTISVTDPHPALDYARYRIVATDNNTGMIAYNDIPSELVGGKAIIIQWDEAWSTFDTEDDEDATDQPSSTGSFLFLPYNIDVSDKYNQDVELVEYIGRSHPVSYYGTQKGYTSTWNVAIEKDDEETLYSLRRLALWPGDVYVREPSGSGYWAHVKVSFNQTHRELTIPVTLDITRVEGGM